MRRGVLGALAAILVLPACASATSSGAASHAVSPGSTATATASATVDARARKPITVKVGQRLFGLHDTSMDSLARPGVGSLRLWDAGVMWASLEPAPGVFDWSRLDTYVEKAHAHGTEVTLVLAGTPSWASTTPVITQDHPTTLWDMPRLTAYRAFVTAVMQRYQSFDPDGAGPLQPYRGITDYQVWNEPNIATFWTGSLQQMAQLTRTVWQVRQDVDRGAKVIAPSMVVRLDYQRKAAKAFYQRKVAGKPVWKYVDAATFSLYPVDTVKHRPAGPEDSMTLVKRVRSFLSADKVPTRLPIWNSEINYGYKVGKHALDPAAPISDAKQAAYVLRTYILNAANGVARVFWYRYDSTDVRADTHMVELADPSVISPAGTAFYTVQKWLKGATLVGTPTARPCTKDRHGTYTCVVRYGKSSMGRIYWNPTRTVTKRTVASTRSTETGLGAARTVGHPVTLKVDYLPVLVRSTH
jgi:hypothetical protein